LGLFLNSTMAKNPLVHTYAEVFIIESLTLDDEANNRYEGKILADVLRLCGKDPKYYYFRTKDELYMLADLYRESSYRFLHLSCHGDYEYIHTTLEKVPYLEFATIFSGLLKNRRLFVSACDVGNELFSEIVVAKNRGMYSIACPTTKIFSDQAVAFWSAFYVKLFSDNMSYVKNDSIAFALKRLCDLYGADFFWFWHHSHNNTYAHQAIYGQYPNFNAPRRRASKGRVSSVGSVASGTAEAQPIIPPDLAQKAAQGR